jgi:hypothetical protein
MSKRSEEVRCPHDLRDCLACALAGAERALIATVEQLSVVEGSEPLRWRAVASNGSSGEGPTPVDALDALARSGR